jgi:hypothetical protein
MILGLTGVRGSGKDTLADYLVERYDFKKIAFADPIREKVKFLLQLKTDKEYDTIKRAQLFWDKDHDLFRYDAIRPRYDALDGRHLVREIGMLMLSYDKNQFTNYVTTEISRNVSKFHYVVTDLRMEHEHDCLKRLDAYIVKINTGKVNTDDHVTEVGFDGERCDYTIDNIDRDLQMFEFNVDTMMQERFNVYPSSK